MSRPNGVVDERFDEAGFEVPFAGTFEGDAIPPRGRCQELPTGKDKVSCSNQPQTKAKLCAPGANISCPSIPELWVSSTIEGVPFYYGAVVRTVEGTGGKRKALVRVENKSYQVRLTPTAWRAAQRWITSMSTFGMPIAAVITAGAGPYCRCIKTPKGTCRHDNPGRCTGKKLSNHGAGDAIDITGVMWKDHHSAGSQLKTTLMHSWRDAADQAPLLVRINAALRLSFATVIDYSASDHRDHFHVDTNNGVARSVFETDTERWFLAGCLRSLGYIQRYANPPTWADVQPGLAAFARQANLMVPAASDMNAWREIVARVYGRIALGRPDASIREARRAETLVADERFDEAGFEGPFAGSFEGEALGESEATLETGSEQGEFVLLKQESEGEGEGEGEFVLLGQESEPGDEEGLLPGDEWPVLTRILWPALGFPAVVTPGSDPKREPSLEVDATRCITILVLTNTPKLPANEVAKRLRIVPWSDRARRFIADGKSGSLSAADLVVRTDAPATRLTLTQPPDATEQLIAFGEGSGKKNTIIVNLARKVREIYKGWGLEYLHEIRLSEAATARLGNGQYHVFFNNLKPKENAASDEMTLLIRLGQQRREAELNPRVPRVFPDPLEEYQYEYGSIHEPYSTARTTKRRAEVLHPIFIRPASPRLRLGHVTDLHVDVRHDVYQHNLAKALKEKTVGPHSFNNWNESVSQVYAAAKRDADGVLMTGDLVDYGRGHAGIDFADPGRLHAGIGLAAGLGSNGAYHRDRNWFLFYDILAAENRYTVPVYTNLGNHDWRINPYPPFAVAGAPGPGTLINDSDCFDTTKLKGLLQHAHGAGHQLEYSYDPRWASVGLVDVIKLLVHGLKQKVKLEKKGLPTETNIDSVLWYLLTINPFLDYLWALPSHHRLLMLDWAEDEGILFKKIEDGVQEDYSITPSGFKNAAAAGPRAIQCLTSSQKRMVEHFVKLKSPAKIIGMHVPPIGPWPDWGDDDLSNGFKQYRKYPARGPRNYAVKRNNRVVALNGHPIFAVPPRKGPKGRLLGMDADYNSFMRDREWFIRALAVPNAGVRLVLSGHIHRNGRFGIRIGKKSDGVIVEGELLLRSLDHKEVQGAKSPAVSTTTADVLAPVYVNTTSAGPRGNNHPTEGKHLNVDPGFARIELMTDGEISVLSFRRLVNAAKPSCDVGKARDKKGLPAFAF